MDDYRAGLLRDALRDVTAALKGPKFIWLDGRLINTLYITKIEPASSYREIKGFKLTLITGDVFKIYNQSIEELAEAMGIEMPPQPEKKEVPR